MATEILVQRGPGNTLIPFGEDGVKAVQSLKHGETVKAVITKPRNIKFHRKFFSLLNFGFDYWQPAPAEWQGIQAEKSFKIFREQTTILAGYREVTHNLDGSVKVVAKSISFAKMEDDEFEKLYKAVFNVIWRLVVSKISGFTEELMENSLNQLLEYD